VSSTSATFGGTFGVEREQARQQFNFGGGLLARGVPSPVVRTVR
jgi:hypothetical protein